MNNNYCFRGKRIDSGSWVYGGILNYRERCWIVEGMFFTNNDQIVHIERYEVDPKTVGQFTGLPDNSRTKIFDGDVISIPTDNTFHRIRFNECSFEAYPQKSYANTLSRYHDSSTIIGNIHDNPELLNNQNT